AAWWTSLHSGGSGRPQSPNERTTGIAVVALECQARATVAILMDETRTLARFVAEMRVTMNPMTRRGRRIAVGVFRLAVVAFALIVAASDAHADAPAGQLTWALHFSLAPSLFEPAETPGLITPFLTLYALHDALVKPMPGKNMAPSLAQSWSTSADGLV